MLRDSRYTVEHWLARTCRRERLVGFVFPLQYYPRLERFNHAEITSSSELEEYRPLFYVLNADYARAEPPTGHRPADRGSAERTVGYRLVFRFREPAPWPWLPGAPRDLVGDRTKRPITSVLRHINPWYEVFKKAAS